jgi:hypothetical protein
MKSLAHDDGELQNARKSTRAALRPPPYAINALTLPLFELLRAVKY